MEHMFKKYIPLDKSWIIRMGILDLADGKEKDSITFLKRQKFLGDDLKALLEALQVWHIQKAIYVGESATLYRFLQFFAWKTNAKKNFIRRGTLKKRHVTTDSRIITLPLKKLLALDNGTSQWASAAVLLGSGEKINQPPYKLKLTAEAVAHWRKMRRAGLRWQPRYDSTINRQAETFLACLAKKSPRYNPEQAEDYCFARALGFITKQEGESRWPNLCNHESNRIKEMERMLWLARAGKKIPSRDHRVVQAIAMKQTIDGRPIRIAYPNVVNKSWPQFWKFLAYTKKIKGKEERKGV